MKAVILAGGKGTRLLPYTTIFPKPLVPLGNMPIIEVIVRQLYYFNIHEVTISLGYHAQLIKAYFHDIESRLPGMKISYSEESNPTGTAGCLSMINHLDGPLLVMNGDVLTTLDYTKLIKYHQEMKGLLTIATHKKIVNIDLGVINANKNGIVTDYIEKPKKEYNVSMGIYIYEPSVLKYIEYGEHLDFPELVLLLLDRKKKVVCYPSDDHWLDIGRHQDYEIAQNEFSRLKDKFLHGTDYDN